MAKSQDVCPASAWRLGSTSYVHPAGLVDNVRRLAPVVDDVELILFEQSSGAGNLPDVAEVAVLQQIASQFDLTYTVHLPVDLRGDAPADSPMWRLTERVVQCAGPLDPWAWVFHLDGHGVEDVAWRDQALNALQRLADLVDDPSTLALENLESYAPEELEWLFARVPLARTLDIGHLWKAGRNPGEFLAEWLPHSRVVHLHGCEVRGGRAVDHLPLTVTRTERLVEILAALKEWQGVLTLEVFEDDFFASLAALGAAPGLHSEREAPIAR